MMRRSNSARNQTKGPMHAPWFTANVRRWRKHNKAARIARRLNR